MEKIRAKQETEDANAQHDALGFFDQVLQKRKARAAQFDPYWQLSIGSSSLTKEDQVESGEVGKEAEAAD